MFLALSISGVDSSLAAPNIPIWTANVFIGLPSASEQNGGSVHARCEGLRYCPEPLGAHY
jgi:hypothetical protein